MGLAMTEEFHVLDGLYRRQMSYNLNVHDADSLLFKWVSLRSPLRVLFEAEAI